MRICSKCKKELEESDFYLRDKNKKVRHSACKICTKSIVQANIKKQGSYGWWYRRYYKLKERAIKRNIEFALSLKEFVELKSQKTCSYCGLNDKIMTIDRADNLLGYSKSNCVLSCHLCNLIKSNIFNRDEMEIVGEAIKLYKNRTSPI